MEILQTPDSLRSPRVAYPWHMRAPNNEEGFYGWACAHAAEVKTDLVYLPIFWWNNAYWQTRRGERERDYHPVAAAQDFLDRLDVGRRYFTVSNCDDGIYEGLPPNVVVFNAGGRGDFPIPLFSEPMERRDGPRDLLASFLGNLRCGGPVTSQKCGHSSWDPGGCGATIRRDMAAAFAGQAECLVEQGVGGTHTSLSRFREVLWRSRFALCPRGYGLTSYRLYEAIDAGCAPVYLYDSPWLPYWDQWDWSELAVLCHRSEIEQLPDRLRNTDPAPMAAKLAGLHEEFFTREGAYRQIARYVESL